MFRDQNEKKNQNLNKILKVLRIYLTFLFSFKKKNENAKQR